MKFMKHFMRWQFFLVVLFFLAGCAGQKTALTPTSFRPVTFDTKKYVQKTDNFLVILDASSSMDESFKGRSKLMIARDIVNRMNQTIPNLQLTGGLRTLGHSLCPFSTRTDLIYGMTRYSKEGLEEALHKVKYAGGRSPLAKAMQASCPDLKPVQGQIAVIIVSDGKEMNNEPVLVAETMRRSFKDRLCIYTILVGQDSQGAGLLEKVAGASGCGFSVTAEQISSRRDMAGFVEKVFLTKEAAPCKPLDSDGDGVIDANDKCPGTPKGVKVDAKGCPLDSDGDGVYDYMDECPRTPKGVKVDAKGCPLDTDGDGVYDYKDKCPGTPKGADVDERGCWVLKGVYFDTNQYTIKTRSYAVLDRVLSVLKKNPDLKVEIQGHTDNRGAAAYNQKLSENRAKAIMDYFIQSGIAGYRLRAKGYGLTVPAVPNTTAENMAKNRRVELKPFR
ncbi:MAG: OmpA family protein [Desulfatiglans sp.]|jgi:OOP family OmpA-OmpF porin|nr:OmpA family protein [Thermodesulfobacteriota bacterium]MEE4351535.1 OmpA family protein [Desulfatiglans sp.]